MQARPASATAAYCIPPNAQNKHQCPKRHRKRAETLANEQRGRSSDHKEDSQKACIPLREAHRRGFDLKVRHPQTLGGKWVKIDCTVRGDNPKNKAKTEKRAQNGTRIPLEFRVQCPLLWSHFPSLTVFFDLLRSFSWETHAETLKTRRQ